MLSHALALFLIFAEPGFPAVGLDLPLPFPEGDHVIAATSVTELIEELTPERVLVWRHGGAFPAEAWPALVGFLEAGGRLLHLGGEPFTHPVTGPPGNRIVQPATVSLLKELNLNRTYMISIGGARHIWCEREGGEPAAVLLPEDARVWILEPRLSETSRVDSEDGSDGPREGIVRPLSCVHLAGEDERFPAAAGALAIDRLEGRFAGGRWVFRLLSTPPARDELDFLMIEALAPVTDSRLDPLYGCFHEGEQPEVILRLFDAGAIRETPVNVSLTLIRPDGRERRLSGFVVQAGRASSVPVPLPRLTEPGLYRLRARIDRFQPAETGFWIMDDELFNSGDTLTFDAYTMLRNGIPEPVVGSTVMSYTVHRQFLFEPDAAVWDDTFREMAQLGMNITRTGVWTGFDRIMSAGDGVDEAWLRALEAYYLSARRHGIPVIFTFFAFTPPAWGGVSPYFDPVSISAQKRYISAVAARFKDAKEMIWDLINEPSFANPRRLWSCRPNGDDYEQAAFREWLQLRYAGNPEDPDDTAWEDTVRARWRLLPDEAIGLPRNGDFAELQLMDGARPYRAKEYLNFAQEAFAQWVGEMTAAIRTAGSPAAVTVGQDEGGLVERPTPLFHGRGVDFTSMHTWWNNDAQLWDALMARWTGKPLLVSETGIMQRELLSGESLRPLEGYADLLGRKLAAVLAAGAFGVIEWVYDVNPYMPSDNEAAIGLRRPDGSYKPEHRVLREFAAFIARHGPLFRDPVEPEIAVVVPFSGLFGPRNLQTDATRTIVRNLVEIRGAPIRMVSEYRTGEQLGTPRLIILPACSGISDDAWHDILSAVEDGATLHCSGYFEADDAGLPAERLGVHRRPLMLVEPVADPPGTEVEGWLRFPLEAVESGYAADHGAMPDIIEYGAGRIRHYALPLEWAEPNALQRCYHALSMHEAGAAASGRFRARTPEGLGVYLLDFTEHTLVVAINETASARTFGIVGAIREEDRGSREVFTAAVEAGAGRLFLLTAGGELVDSTPELHTPHTGGDHDGR